MNCPYCNSGLSTAAKFCPKCGNRIPDHIMVSTPKSGGSLIIPLVIFLFVAGVGAFGYFYFFAKPKAVEPLKPSEREPITIADPPPQLPVDKEQEVPMPDAKSSEPQKPVDKEQEVPMSDAKSSESQEEEITAPETSDPMRITGDVEQPVLIHKVSPEYPEIARKARIQGVVILEAVITKKGIVENVKVLRGLHPILDQSAVNAVQQWRYKPATLNGVPVKVYFTVTVKFRLE
jgi:TonB family protein